MIKSAELVPFLAKVQAKGANRIDLRHQIFDPKGQAAFVPLMSWDLFDGIELEDLAVEVLAYARDDAAHTGGAQTYSVFGELGKESHGQRRFTIEGSRGVMEDAGGPTHAPNETGALALQMDMNKAFLKAFIGYGGSAMKYQAEVIEQQAAMIAAYQNRELTIFQQRDELADRRQERDVQIAKLGHALDVKKRLFDHVDPAISMAMSKLMGTPLGHDVPDTFDRLLSSITPEQFQKLQEVLHPAQFATLGEIYEEREKQKRAKAEAEAARRAASSNGAANGNGAAKTT